MLCITNNAIKHQSFVYTQLNNQTVLFQTIQFSINHLFALSLNIKQFYSKRQTVQFDAEIGSYQVLPLRGQSGPGSHSNEEVLHIPQISKASLSISCHIWDTH